MTNKLHPQELADLLQKTIVMDGNNRFFAHGKRPHIPFNHDHRWAISRGDLEFMNVTHAIAKPDDCPEWDKAIWEPRVMPKLGQLCLFSDVEEKLTLEDGQIGYLVDIEDGDFPYSATGDYKWRYCKPIDNVPSRIDLDAQRSE